MQSKSIKGPFSAFSKKVFQFSFSRETQFIFFPGLQLNALSQAQGGEYLSWEVNRLLLE